MRIVLDDQQDGVPGFEIEPVVRQLLDDTLLGRRPASAGAVVWNAEPAGARDATVGPEYFSGRYSVKVLPLPGALRRWISPPSRLASSRLMARPRPVPPYLRLVPASACWNASKISFCFSRGMPMPVSDHLEGDDGRRRD